LRAERLTWGLPGGPRQAWLRASLPPQSAVTAETALEWLRYGVLIAAQSGRPGGAGCGGGTARRRAVLERGARRVMQPRGGPVQPAPGGVNAEGERCLSAWAEDALSRGVYGRKERLLSLGSLTESAALRARDAFLAANAAPQIRMNAAAPAEEPFIVLECQGWWDTLAWVLAPRLSRQPGFLEPARPRSVWGAAAVTPPARKVSVWRRPPGSARVGVDGKVMAFAVMGCAWRCAPTAAAIRARCLRPRLFRRRKSAADAGKFALRCQSRCP
jgi:hypothetical protein